MINTSSEEKIKMDTIEFFDGESDGVFIPRTVDTWSEANGFIIQHSFKMKPTSNYHKLFFRITFQDGFEYEGRYDVEKSLFKNVDLGNHIFNYSNIKFLSPETRDFYDKFFEKYEIPRPKLFSN